MPDKFEATSSDVQPDSEESAARLRGGRTGDALLVGYSEDGAVALRVEHGGSKINLNLTPDQAEGLARCLTDNAIRARAAAGAVQGEKQPVDLGPCCACGIEGPSVRTLVSLPRKAPKPGTGWLCTSCELPADGALAVVCAACLDAGRPPIYACDGYPSEGKRIRITELLGWHDPTQHARPHDRV